MIDNISTRFSTSWQNYSIDLRLQKCHWQIHFISSEKHKSLTNFLCWQSSSPQFLPATKFYCWSWVGWAHNPYASWLLQDFFHSTSTTGDSCWLADSIYTESVFFLAVSSSLFSYGHFHLTWNYKATNRDLCIRSRSSQVTTSLGGLIIGTQPESICSDDQLYLEKVSINYCNPRA